MLKENLKCKKCWKEFKKHWRFKNYCSNKCLYWRKHNNGTKKKISESLKNSFRNKLKLIKNRFNKKIRYYLEWKYCKNCWNIISYERKTKITCSDKCKSDIHSKSRIKNIIEKWVEFKNKKKDFYYKWKIYKIDSILEKAWIKFLYEKYNFNFIERFKWILNYEINWQRKRFNPDFIWKRNWKIYIIEIKMEWSNNKDIKHIYNDSIPYKKQALESFCKKKGYNMFWLDFKTNWFRSFYKKELNNNKNTK